MTSTVATPKVSIVTISFNQAKYLEDAIISVLGQGYPNIEYIVVDPGSTDGSRDIINRYAEQLDHVVYEPDRGPADGLNRGFAHATGEIFSYVNADDVLLPDAVRSAVNSLARHPDAAAICGNGYLVDRNLALIRRLRTTPFRDVRAYAYGATWVLQQSTFIRAEAFRRVDGFNYHNRTSWDKEVLIDIALDGGLLQRVDGYWSLFRWYDDSISGSKRLRDASLQERDRLIERVQGHPLSHGDRLRLLVARWEKWLTDPGSVGLRVVDLVAQLLRTILRTKKLMFSRPEIRSKR